MHRKEIVTIKEDETLDDLIINQLKIIQPARGYRFSLDAVLLAHFPEVRKLKRIVDMGTGNGIIPVLMSQRAPLAHITGIDIQETMLERANRTIRLNNLETRIELIHADIKNIKDYLTGGCADLVLSNPPFWKKGQGKISNNPEEATARHELAITLGEIIGQASYILRPGGRLAIILPADRLPEALELFAISKLAPRKLRMVHSMLNQEAKLVLLEGEKNSRSPLTILPPLIIYQETGKYTPEILAIYYG